ADRPGDRLAHARGRRRILLLSGHGPRPVARLAAEEARLRPAAEEGGGPASGGGGGVRAAGRRSIAAPPVRGLIEVGGPLIEAARALRRVLNLWDATCIVVGAIIGVGIFFNPRDVAAITGSASAAMLAWMVGGVVALLGAITFAELGRMRPVAGGQYHAL